MKMLLLGTAAADGWPAAYCDCPVCEYARQVGGPNLRMRAGALIDDDLKIDHSPDTVAHMQRARRSLSKVRSIFFTHEHPDHMFPIELKRTTNVAKTAPQHPIAIYATERVLNLVRQAFSDPPAFRLDLKPAIEPFRPVTLPDGDTTLLPLPATHCEDAVLYRITRGGKSIFYGHDSGLYKTETLDALGKAGPLDMALLDCTHTLRTDVAFKHHMSISTAARMVEELRSRGAITEKTRLIATHFSPHSGAVSHEQLVTLAMPYRMEVAYDGMVVEI